MVRQNVQYEYVRTYVHTVWHITVRTVMYSVSCKIGIDNKGTRPRGVDCSCDVSGEKRWSDKMEKRQKNQLDAHYLLHANPLVSNSFSFVLRGAPVPVVILLIRKGRKEEHPHLQSRA